MYDNYPHLPHDIALEKSTANRMKRRYANAAFGGLRNFHALRRNAPGIIAKFLLATALSIAALLYFFHDLNVVGLFSVIGLCIKVVIVIGLSFWITGVVWRSVGLTIRNGIRYVVSNIWLLVATSMLATSAVLYLFFPQNPGDSVSAGSGTDATA